jgi:pyruvate ferredoxin oxidoreductase alpha subunit
MTVANRAIGAPINIWNDHSDSMSQRDSGWIQLYAESNQEALDMHIQAFRLAEAVSLPVMVCMDGFVLTHAYDEVEIPDQDQVDRFLPSFEPRQLLDPADPVTIGAMVGPDAFFEVRYLAHAKQIEALDLIEGIAQRFALDFGRHSGGLMRHYRSDDADTIVIAMGSVLGTIEDVVDELRDEGVAIGAVGLKTFRPFPLDELREAIAGAKRVVVIDRSLSVGLGGPLFTNVRTALSPRLDVHGHSVIAGLGGRAITRASLRTLFERAGRDELGDITFLDLDRELVDRELARSANGKRPGPHAEAMIRDLGETVTGATS